MAKKRKTRQQKIILQLKRQLANQTGEKSVFSPETEPRQESISYRINSSASARVDNKKADKSSYSYPPKLIRKDLLKTIVVALAIVSLEVVLYLKLR